MAAKPVGGALLHELHDAQSLAHPVAGSSLIGCWETDIHLRLYRDVYGLSTTGERAS